MLMKMNIIVYIMLKRGRDKSDSQTKRGNFTYDCIVVVLGHSMFNITEPAYKNGRNS